MKHAPHHDGCAFCLLDKSSPQVLSETKYFKIVRNIFGYSLWDGQKVSDHLMVVPKKHTDSLKDLSAAEAQEFMSIISEYEGKSYNIYARAASSPIKTVVHQHTHLIKPHGSVRRLVLWFHKPYIRFTLG